MSADELDQKCEAYKQALETLEPATRQPIEEYVQALSARSVRPGSHTDTILKSVMSIGGPKK